MMSQAQIRGLLLEEAVLHLLRRAGYTPVAGKGSDPTLEQNGYALFVLGRGERHQIDAIADYLVQPPFSNPQRLLVEAKFYDGRQVGLTVIRNALGVIVDVSQHFVAPPGRRLRKVRYHYQYAVVSATTFTRPSQRYAYAQDIFLIPLGESRFFAPLLQAIRAAAERFHSHPDNVESQQFAGRLRTIIRQHLWDVFPELRVEWDLSEIYLVRFNEFIHSCQEIGFALVAVTASGFPVFLVPRRGLDLFAFEDVVDVRIYRSENTWFLARHRNDELFSFDLPAEVLRLYAAAGELSPSRGLDLKWNELRELRATVVDGDIVRVVRFRLDVPWFEAIRRNIEGN
jgi:hypothetical protein